MDERAANLAGLMATTSEGLEAQVAQTRFRLRLVDQWQIPSGSRVLEIGCGQGDMTAVLADAVGESGHVTAVDIAEPSYGAPISLGEASEHLLRGPLGDRIDFRFKFHVLDEGACFEPDCFDFVVFAHCSWYFPSLDVLRLVFDRIRPWSQRLCFSEWDLKPKTFDQIAHFLAVLIQGQVELHRIQNSSNICTPCSRQQLRKILSDAGWQITLDEEVSCEGMQDGKWEVEHCLRTSIEGWSFPKREEFLRGQIQVLRELANLGPLAPLPSYVVSANRS